MLYRSAYGTRKKKDNPNRPGNNKIIYRLISSQIIHVGLKFQNISSLEKDVERLKNMWKNKYITTTPNSEYTKTTTNRIFKPVWNGKSENIQRVFDIYAHIYKYILFLSGFSCLDMELYYIIFNFKIEQNVI